MRSCNLFTLASAALIALRLQATDASEAKVEKITGTVTSLNCLTQFNEARAAAGLPAFTDGTNDFKVETLDDTFRTTVCTALMKKQPINPQKPYNETIALAVQEGDEGDCAAAVTHFNGALSLFGSLPPAFSTTENVYKNLQAVSFVALYNPKENPKLACGYFKCTSKLEAASGGVPGAGISPAAREAEQESAEATLNGLLCASGPQALLDGKAPFEQEQYNKIKSAINSAAAAVPAFATFAVAAAGLILL